MSPNRSRASLVNGASSWLAVCVLTCWMTASVMAPAGAAADEVAKPRKASDDDQFTLVKDGDNTEILYDGKLVTRYLAKSGAKPIMWPLIGPDGIEMTRSFPMKEGVAGEKADHPHHRSFWFTHGDVNGISFWHENDAHGTIVQQEYLQREGGDTATISTRNDWLGPDGKKVCEDTRTFVFHARGAFRWIDATIVVKATEGQVVFGDTKEGSFGVRVAGWMKEDAKQGGKIVTSEGKSGTDAWGKPARWVDYHGPAHGDGKVVGITIMNHPTSYGFPSHWHVRTYGLFAANPFGLHDFYGANSGKNGKLTLEKGETLTLKYRVLLHPGDHEQGEVEAFYKDYAGE